MKKILSLCIAMVSSIILMGIPTDVFAANIAKVGEIEYSTLQAAINNSNNKEVTLLGNVTESVTIPENSTVTINLGTYTITNVTNQHTITNNGTLTIKGTGTVDNVSHARAAINNTPKGTATLLGGTYTRSLENGQSTSNNGGNSFYTIQNHGNMTIKSVVKVYNAGGYSSMVHNGFQNGARENPDGSLSPTLTIDGGVFDGGLNTVKNDDYGTLTINNGEFKNVKQAVILNWNTTTIVDGTFESEKDVILNGKSDNEDSNSGKLVIKGGSFTAGENGKILKQMSGSNELTKEDINVSGGTYNKPIEEQYYDVPTDKELVEVDGKYVIKSKVVENEKETTKEDVTIKEGPGTYDGIMVYVVLAIASIGTLGLLSKKTLFNK